MKTFLKKNISRSLFPLTPKAVSTDSVETNDINMNNEVDSSLLYPVRRIRFGGRMYICRRGFFRAIWIWTQLL
ncbi:hypothetical protein F8M41_014479 [Gigaspora margarita]|uniref:Uncharacterized protein n=1 Tax=Gigaspora margarita TaxID=4874 RepID=A0A8H4ARN8_GIGMA|nr:hypothetical protein F8M41_014479 [Gigaspora margarita]